MDILIDWFTQNKEWLLSGVAVAVPLAILGWFFGIKRRKQQIQRQRSGDNAINIQVGGDISIKSHKVDEDE